MNDAVPDTGIRSDVGWERRCAALLSFLDRPRTRAEVLRWADERGMSASRLDARLDWLRRNAKGGTFMSAEDVGAATWRRHASR